MSKYLIKDNTLSAIANTIRSFDNTSMSIKTTSMPKIIERIKKPILLGTYKIKSDLSHLQGTDEYIISLNDTRSEPFLICTGPELYKQIFYLGTIEFTSDTIALKDVDNECVLYKDYAYANQWKYSYIPDQEAYQLFTVSNISIPYPIRVSQEEYDLFMQAFDQCSYSNGDLYNNNHFIKDLTSAQYSYAGNIDQIGPNAFVSTALMSVFAPNVSVINDTAFRWCRDLNNVYIPNVQYIGTSAFGLCSNLSQISLPKVQTIGSAAFANCYALASISFPECSIIDKGAFSSCSNLSIVSLPTCLTVENSAFLNCSNLKSVHLPKCTTVNKAAFAFSTTITAASSQAYTLNLPSCTTLGESAFYNNPCLTNISLPEVTSIPQSCFTKCIALSQCQLGSACNTIMGYAFQSCYSLLSIGGAGCTSIGTSAFYNCSNLQYALFNNCTYVGSLAFYSNNLYTLNSGFSFPKLCTIQSGAFYNAFSNSFPYGIYLSSTTNNLNLIGSNAFYGNSALYQIHLRATSTLSIYNYAFAWTNLKTLRISCTRVPTLVHSNAFYSTPIANGYKQQTGSSYVTSYGSIYVPKSLYNAFKTATNWAYYSARFVSF